MKKLLTAVLCAASMSLASCATIPTPSTEQAGHIGSAIDRAQAVYNLTAASAKLVLPTRRLRGRRASGWRWR